MPESVDSTLDVHIRNDGKIAHNFTKSQIFKPEDYVEIYDNTVEQVEGIKEDIEELEEEIENQLDQYEESMAAIHTLLAEEEQNQPEYLEADALTSEDFDRFQQLKQKKQQRQKMMDRKDQIEMELSSMEEAVEEVREE